MPAIDVPNKIPGDDLFAREVNEITRNINSLLGTKGPNTIIDSAGVHQRREIIRDFALKIARVVSNATGGGYYNCLLQRFDATDWNTTTNDQLDDIGSSVIVLNLSEIPISGDTSSHELSANDLITCQQIIDDQGNARLVGIAALRYKDCTG